MSVERVKETLAKGIVFTLSKPLVLEPAAGDVPAKTISSLTLDLDKLTGADVEMCAREATVAAGSPPVALVLDVGFHAQIAARASGLPVETLRKLRASDYLAVTTVVQGFLLGAD